MGDESNSDSHDTRDEDDEDDYEEADEKNGLLGFMFGNVDGAGELDVDYLDADAKEHLGALAGDLRPSLTDIDLSVKSADKSADASEQDYDEKAEDAVDYEDIEEQYEGPETQAISEEDHLLSKKEFSYAKMPLTTGQLSTSVFGEENYDEEPEGDDIDATHTVVSTDEILPLAGTLVSEHSSEQPSSSAIEKDPELSLEKAENLGMDSGEEKSLANIEPSLEPIEADSLSVDSKDIREDDELRDLEESRNNTASLPILCIEDGKVVLRFSEIFGVHEPPRKREQGNHRDPIPKDKLKIVVEEDEEDFLRGPLQSSSNAKLVVVSQYDDASVRDSDGVSMMSGVGQGIGLRETQAFEQTKVTCLSAEPMKESVFVDLASEWVSPSCPKFYPLDQQIWEDEIIWNNSPVVGSESSESSIISGIDMDGSTNVEIESGNETRDFNSDITVEPTEKGHSVFLSSYPVSVEPFGSRTFSGSPSLPFSEMNHPQLLRLESRFKDGSSDSEIQTENSENLHKRDAISLFSKRLSLRNMELLDGSWLDQIIWEPKKDLPKPKLILDLQDEQMLFEVLDNKDSGNLRFHAGAMIVSRSVKSNGGDSLDNPGQGGGASKFNISNDRYYSNRKMSQQTKSHSKKRTAHGVKIWHSIPGLMLQTMKSKLSNKDIAYFHRPKAVWYPHDNEVAAKEQGKLSTQGPMKVILKSMGGKGSKFQVAAEDIVSYIKTRASKKLDFRPSEQVKIIYSGKELEDSKSLAIQNVRPNSVLHLVRTSIHLWPRAQKVPGENMSLRPPGAFKKVSDLSVKDGHVFLMEYCEERPLLIGNAGMGARLCTYYQKSAPVDQTASVLRNECGGSNLGTVISLDPADKSPFLGDIRPGCTQSSLETNMYRAPVFPHKLPTTDYLLVRSAKGKLFLRRIDRIHVVGQQEPHMEVISPGSKNLQTYIGNRLLVYMYRVCRVNEKRGMAPCIRADELAAQFPSLSEPIIRKRLKHCAELQKGTNGQLFWVIKHNFRIPVEEELRRQLTPENVCCYESMQAGLYRLKRLGISRLTHPTGLSSAMNQLPDEAIALAASSHIERELQITPWNLSSNFVTCTNQDRENIERLEITGVGDPSGRGLGFSYVRVATKASISNAVVKKKIVAPRVGGTTVTGTDADLRRLNMDGAREVLLKFNVPEDTIAKQTRWHRIAMIRKLSSEQASAGVKVDATTIGKYARGQRMSFLQLQQQAREKCQEIWDRQLQNLSAAEGDENESDSEANSDLDSFAGDLENLLDAEECGEAEVGSNESKQDKIDGVRGLKMRRHPTQVQAEEEIEDEAAEAAELCRMLMDDNGAKGKKKKKTVVRGREELGLSWQRGLSAERINKANGSVKQVSRTAQPDGSFTSMENIIHDQKEVDNIRKRNFSGIIKSKKLKNDKVREKHPSGKNVREGFVCGACGQAGHMRTNKNCPRYGEDPDTHVENSILEKIPGKLNLHDSSAQPKSTIKKIIPKIAARNVPAEAQEKVEKAKTFQLKVKCALPDKSLEQSTTATQNSEKQDEMGSRSVSKYSKIIISNKMKHEDFHGEPQKQPSIVIRPPLNIEKPPRKKIIIKQPKVDQVREEVRYGMQEEHRKTEKMMQLSSYDILRKQEQKRLADEAAAKRKAKEDKKFWEEENKRRVIREAKEREREREREIERERGREMILYQERMMQLEQNRLAESRRIHEALQQREKEELERQKMKKKKKVKFDETGDDYYLEEPRGYRTSRRMPERSRAAKKRPAVDSSARYGPEYGQQTKRRRGGEGQVGLANTLENILDGLKNAHEVSYLFLKPVSKKEAPDYLDIIEHPMDLSTIREKARRMEYKDRDEFRHDVCQITINAHKYNAVCNPGIPPLADQLLELCDYFLDQFHERLSEAEASIDT
ncbi:transcription initiation factor TFIID subunit 1-like isoform X1 [Papaver somniferum]|uniref:transcription initiation factor TFIID subunit 1-like isoform X1 n=1 Tax=Papaver somniferum TaxID=3469 RepID=UPI000E70552C|nr:transcription initiation factor TFIID subunit 1-like isoform X1 [Papaver somniferum]